MKSFFLNTILKIFRVKGKENFYLEIANGKVEVVYNGRRRKLKKQRIIKKGIFPSFLINKKNLKKFLKKY